MSNEADTATVTPAHFFVVGIGASAGGLQSLELFFGSLPANTEAAFIVVQHLSPDVPTLMPELLQQATDLPVRVIEDGMRLEVGQVFVLPPGHWVTLEEQRLHLEIRQAAGIPRPIDRLFLSLSQSGHDRIIGVLLSGTGSDGTQGLRAIHRAGGISLVQSPETTQFSSMVENAIAAGVVDQVLPPDELAQTVEAIVNYSNAFLPAQDNAEATIPTPLLNRILSILQEQEQLDFTQYKSGTLNRRILHRLILSKATSLEGYLQLLRRSPEEVKRLGQDLLIGSTRFFRDPEVWDLLETEVLPQIIATLQPEQPLRMWVTACATGEEAYTLAIVANDVMTELGQHHPIKIFATDIDVEALAIASQGIYADTISQHISDARLNRYFTYEHGVFTVKAFLRNQIVFAPHDLVRNAGFSQMRLVCCRNVLIYMQPSLQQQVLRLLHFSLVPQGTLVLGLSEGVGTLEMAYSETNGRLKIFQKYTDTPLGLSSFPRQTPLSLPPPAVRSRPTISQYDRLWGVVLRLGFGDRPITCVLVNGRNQLLHVFCNTAQLLSFPTEEANLTLTDMVPLSLKLPLSNALLRIRRDRQPLVYTHIALPQAEPRGATVNLHISQADSRTPSSDMLVVFMEQVLPLPPPSPVAATYPAQAVSFEVELEAAQHIADLEAELQQTRDQLQHTVEELETTNEEYQATNEELLASNEELQSTNEELQSLNEELYTLNAENQNRIEQLTELNADISNLLSSTDIGVVFLDRQLNIRRFTLPAAQFFSLRPTDVGRPLTELTHSLDVPDLIAQLQQVATTHISIEQEVSQSQTQQVYLMRLLPYCREDGTADGVVLTLVDISEIKRTQQALQQVNGLLASIYRTSPVGLCLLNAEQRYLLVNETLAEMNGLSVAEHLGRSPAEVLPELAETFQTLVQQVLTTGEAIYNYEITGSTQAVETGEKTWLASYYPVPLLNGERGVGITVNDITKLKQSQKELAEQRAFAQAITESTPDIVTLFDIPSGRIFYVNYAITRLLGHAPDDLYRLGETALEQLVHPDDLPTVQAHYAAMRQAADGEVHRYELRIRHQNGTWCWFEQRDTVFRRDPTGCPVELLGISTDISDRLQAQQALERSENLFRKTLENSRVTVFTQDLDLRYTWIYNPAGTFTREQILGRTDTELFATTAQANELIALKQRVLTTQHPLRQELTTELADGSGIQHFDCNFSPLYDTDGVLVGLMAVVVNITERKQAELALERTRQQLEEAQRVARIGNWQEDLATQTLYWSQETFRIVGIDPGVEQLSMETWLAMIAEGDRPRFQKIYALSRANGTPFNLDVQIQQPTTNYRCYINIIGNAERDARGRVIRLFGTVLDVSDRKQTEAALHQQAFYDQLTQLPNRALFLEQLKQSIHKIRRPSESQFAVLYLDIDAFKEVNDTLGHGAGDALLVEFGQRLQSCIRPGDMVARLGGDEFAMLLEPADEATAIAVAQRIQQTLSQPANILGQRLDTTVSIGIALYNPHLAEQSDTTLLENADIAMYRAKKRGSGQTEVFMPVMRSQDTARIELKTALKQALENQEFVLYYQPIINLQTMSLSGFEVLLRWQASADKILIPADFMDVLRTSPFMYEVEIWILRAACQQLQRWMHDVPTLAPDIQVSVNLSPSTLEEPNLVVAVERILHETQIQPSQLVLEITEHSFINTSGLIPQTLKELQRMGLHFALDDFGTGYASLSCLHQLPITTLKIDRTFIQALGTDDSLQQITSGISALSQALDLKLVAEGIETSQQLAFLQQNNCTYGQGYFFSYPLSVADATNLLERPTFDDI